MNGWDMSSRFNNLAVLRKDEYLCSYSSQTCETVLSSGGGRKYTLCIWMGIGRFSGIKEVYVNERRIDYSPGVSFGIKNAVTEAIVKFREYHRLQIAEELLADALYERLYTLVHISEEAEAGAGDVLTDDEAVTSVIQKIAGETAENIISYIPDTINAMSDNICQNRNTLTEKAYAILRTKGGKGGRVCLSGKSGSGKTPLLYKLRNSLPCNVKIFTNEDIVNMIIAMCRGDMSEEGLVDKMNCDLLCIDNIDYLKGKPNTLLCLYGLIEKLDAGTCVVFSGIDVINRLPEFVAPFPGMEYIDI